MMRTPWIIAHRGASAVAPESTRAAILAAIRAGAQMIELDVQMTRDGRLVVFHDERIDRTTNGTGRLSVLRYHELIHLDAGGWFHRRFRGERILLLSHVLRLVPKRIWLNLELKRTARPHVLVTKVMRLARATRSVGRLLVSSFDESLLRPWCGTRFSRALICRRDPERSLQQAIRLHCFAWHPHDSLITPRRVQRAHAAGLRVHVWTVDEPVRARKLLRWGVDGLFTNHPGQLVKHLRRGQ